MGYESLRREDHGHVAVVTLNRPEKLNALNASLRADVRTVFADLHDDDDVWAVVLTGEGRGFCAGADLSGARSEDEQSQNERLDEFGWVGHQALTVFGFDKPTVAAVNGVAVGAGMSLALACDLRVGGPSARFKTVFVERSLSPDSGMSYFLPRIIGYSRAADLIFTNRAVDADEAYRLGLLDRLIADDAELLPTALGLAEDIIRWPPVALRSGKRVLQHNLEVGLVDALRYESAGLDFARRAPGDVKESQASFRERRPGKFTGR